MSDQHYPHVVITVPRDPKHWQSSHVVVDGVEWPVIDYRIAGGVNEIQNISLSFIASVELKLSEENATSDDAS